MGEVLHHGLTKIIGHQQLAIAEFPEYSGELVEKIQSTKESVEDRLGAKRFKLEAKHGFCGNLYLGALNLLDRLSDVPGADSAFEEDVHFLLSVAENFDEPIRVSLELIREVREFVMWPILDELEYEDPQDRFNYHLNNVVNFAALMYREPTQPMANDSKSEIMSVPPVRTLVRAELAATWVYGSRDQLYHRLNGILAVPSSRVARTDWYQEQAELYTKAGIIPVSTTAKS